MYSFVRKILGLNWPTKTFTYYVPAPPRKDRGHREKEFDKVLYNYLKLGHELVSLKTVPHSGEGGAGMWIVCTVRPTKKSARKFMADYPSLEDFSEKEIVLDEEFTIVHE